MRLARIITSLIVLFSSFISTNLICADTKSASLLPQWIPQAQFAGYMVALDKGFYKEAGIELNLLRGGPEVPALDQLEKGQCTFATAWLSTGIQQRSSGAKIVNLAQIVQRSALMLVARKSSGIKVPADLQNKKVALWGGDFRIQPLAFFLQNKLQVDIIPLYGTPNLLLKGGVDAMSAMWYNEYHSVLLVVINEDELISFFLSEAGLNFPEDGIYCLAETFIKDPDLCSRFVKASLQGWLYAFEHEQEALDIVIKYAHAAHTGTNRAHQKWMLERMRDLIIPGGDKSDFGKLQAVDYSIVAKILHRLDLIQNTPLFSDFYKGSK